MRKLFFSLLIVFTFLRCENKSKFGSESEINSGQDCNNIELNYFGSVIVDPFLILDGSGEDIDQIAIWEALEIENTMIFVTAKANKLVEIWKYPFENNEQEPLIFPEIINGLAIDQEKNELYVAENSLKIKVFSLPDLDFKREFGKGIISIGETSLDILKKENNERWIYVTDQHKVNYFTSAGEWLGEFTPDNIMSIEEILIDNYTSTIYIPEEAGPRGTSGVHSFMPDGTPKKLFNISIFGSGVFEADGEGITLYRIFQQGKDTGQGFIIASDQKPEQSDFEFFDRKKWVHLGKINISGVSNTDGIAVSQKPLPNFPKGFFAAVNNDKEVIIVGWDTILDSIGLNLN